MQLFHFLTEPCLSYGPVCDISQPYFALLQEHKCDHTLEILIVTEGQGTHKVETVATPVLRAKCPCCC